MAKVRLRDMVVVLPGIVGSVLEKDGKDVWALSGQAAWGALRGLGDSLKALKLDGDDPRVDDLGDGVRASRLIPDFHIVPGLCKVDGYSGLRRLFQQRFDVVPGDPESPKPANYFEFPYDWRRDNRVSARRLQRLVESALPRWRDYSGARDARVILLAHSMGGLVSRHYLEVLGGWQHCRALVTFGTPHRGSLNALDFLANGYKKAFLDLTEMMRSLTSVYQLLPIYQAVGSAQGYQRIAEGPDLPHVERDRATAALAFHREIEAAVEGNRQDSRFSSQGYEMVPIVGIRQRTKQSAWLDGDVLRPSFDSPPAVEESLADGDGTVPRISAVPIELTGRFRDTYFAQQHGALQNTPKVLDQLFERLKLSQNPQAGAVRGGGRSGELSTPPSLGLEVEDLFLADEPVLVRGQLFDGDDPGKLGPLVARIEPLTSGDSPQQLPLERRADSWEVRVAGLAAGTYRVTLSASGAPYGGPPPVDALFEVAGA